MKNTSIKILGAVAIFSAAAGVYAFANNEDPKEGPEYKKYEVVRMVDGEMTEFDTLIASTSDYSPQDYLNDLGFGEDENTMIIDMVSFNPDEFIVNMEAFEGEMKEFEKQMIKFEGEMEKMGEELERTIQIEIDEEMQGTPEGKDENERQEIKKHVLIKEGADSLSEVDIEMEIEGLIEELNIDSIIRFAEDFEKVIDSQTVVMNKFIILDDAADSDENYSWEEKDKEGATFHREVHKPGHHLEVAIWGDESEDFTMLIISPANESGSTATLSGEEPNLEMSVYPNPAKAKANLQLDIQNKSETNITITDASGRVVFTKSLGKYSGRYKQELDVRDWNRGVYFVQAETQGEKLIEKLVVE